MGDVIVFSRTGKTPDELLEDAKGQLKRVVIVGVTNDDSEYAELSGDYAPDMFWDLHLAAYRLLKSHDEE